MREIEPTLTPELSAHVGKGGRLEAAPPFDVPSYDELVRIVAKLAYLNKDHLLFFRGQAADCTNKAGSSTIYPSIYRGDPIPAWELKHRFNVLEQSGSLLAKQFAAAGIDGARDVARRPHVRWSILQHYEVCPTPLLDLTHSLWVAASFATLEGNAHGIVYVVGLPQLSNRISVNSEHDLVTIRNASMTAGHALRPIPSADRIAEAATPIDRQPVTRPPGVMPWSSSTSSSSSPLRSSCCEGRTANAWPSGSLSSARS